MVNQIEFIRQNADKLSDAEIGRELNLTKQQILNRRKKYGIPSTHGKDGRIRKGNTPWNKNGKNPGAGGCTKFKPGHKPFNTREDGATSMRRDGKVIRISEGYWMPYKRYLWEQHYGKVPDDHVVVSKDGNHLTEDINNMECISRAENCRRNENRKKASQTIKKTWEKQKRRIRMGLSPVCGLGLKKPRNDVRGIVREPAKYINFD